MEALRRSALMAAPYGLFVDANQNILVVDRTLSSLRVVYNGGAAMACIIELENPTLFPAGPTTCAGATPPTLSTPPTVGYIYKLAGGNGVSLTSGFGDGLLASSAQLRSPGELQSTALATSLSTIPAMLW